MRDDLKTDVRPDWITITGKYKSFAGVSVREPEYSADVMDIGATLIDGLLHLGWHDYGVWREVKAPPHYRYALQSKEGGVLIAFGPNKQGWMVQLQGVWWARREKWGNLQGAINTFELHVSRFDFSLTVQAHKTNGSWALWSGAWAEMQRDTRGDLYPVFAKPYAPTPLKTVTAGSRKSPVFIRCYDKDYWVDEDSPAVRLEAEYKKDAAGMAFAAWCEGGNRSQRDVLRRFFGPDLAYPEPWHMFYDGVEHKNIPSTLPPPESDRCKWFWDIVRKAFMKWADEDNERAAYWAKRAFEYAFYGTRFEAQGEQPED